MQGQTGTRFSSKRGIFSNNFIGFQSVKRKGVCLIQNKTQDIFCAIDKRGGDSNV